MFPDLIGQKLSGKEWGRGGGADFMDIPLQPCLVGSRLSGCY